MSGRWQPDKPLSQTTGYLPISLLSAIMKLFERVNEKRFRKHFEDNGFFSKYQSGFRKSKSTKDHLFRLAQTIMKNFNRGEHVIAASLDVEKAFDNVWHNGLRYKICQLDLPTRLCRWLSNFLVGRVIQVKTEGFLPPKVYPKAGVPQGSNLRPLLSFSMPMTCQIQVHIQRCNEGRTCFIFIWRPSFILSSHKILTFDNRMTFTKHFEEILERCNHRFHRLRILVNTKSGPSSTTILQICKHCVRPIFEYGIVSTITVLESVINKIQRV